MGNIKLGNKKEACDFFEEILAIPRESGNEGNISQYLVNFAKNRNLEYYVDDVFNVIIRKPGTIPGNNEPIIFQAHTDMVCTSEEEYDFLHKGIEWYVEDGFYKASKTSLGADNGAGIAIILSLLNDDFLHPPIEAIFTTQEETTMEGAKNLNYQLIRGKRLISLDGTEEDKIEVSCAGMASMKISKKVQFHDSNKSSFKLKIGGLLGGHSGVDIHLHRGNAIKILSHILSAVDDIEIVSIDGGTKENVIPSSASCTFQTDFDMSAKMDKLIKKYKEEYPMITIRLERCSQKKSSMSHEDSKNILNYLEKIEDGVLVENDENFPITSSNVGVIETKNGEVIISQSIRSSLSGYEDFYVSRARRIAATSSLHFKLIDKKPFFTYKEDSELRQLLVKKYGDIFHKKITLENVHAGLEGGIFAHEIPNLDMCVIGVNLYDIHSVNEKVEKKSIERVVLWLKECLKEMS